MNDVEVCWTPRWRRMDSNHWSRSQDTPVSFAKNDDAPKVQPEAVAAGVLRGRPRPHGALRLVRDQAKGRRAAGDSNLKLEAPDGTRARR